MVGVIMCKGKKRKTVSGLLSVVRCQKQQGSVIGYDGVARRVENIRVSQLAEGIADLVWEVGIRWDHRFKPPDY